MALVTFQLPAGSNVPTRVHMRDGTFATPNAAGQITVDSMYTQDLMASGWQIVVSSGTTHVP